MTEFTLKITEENLLELTPAVIDTLDKWEVSASDAIQLLGLAENTPHRDLQKMRRGTKTLPFDDEVVERIEHIFGITEALRTSFPFSADIRKFWLRQPHRRFKRQAPLTVMLAQGLAGIEKVRIEVDCAYGWQISEALAEQHSKPD